MTLRFLNPSRSFDADNGCVRFVGHDGMKSVPFTVPVAALGLSGGSEPQALAAFDAHLQAVHKAAQSAYANASQTTYSLGTRDLR